MRLGIEQNINRETNETFRARYQAFLSVNVGSTILCESKAQDS